MDSLAAQDRVAFERRFALLRLLALCLPVPLVLALGPAALGPAALLAVVVVGTCGFSWVLARRYQHIVQRYQLALRLLDVALLYILVHSFDALLRDASYDIVYVLPVVAATATHGRRGAILLSVAAGLATLVGRLQLIGAGVLPYAPRHFSDSLINTIIFTITGLSVAYLIKMSAGAVQRREDVWRSALEGMSYGVLMVDQSARIVSINPAATAMFHRETADTIGQDVEVLLPTGATGATSPGGIAQLLKGQDRLAGGEVVGRRRDGALFPIELSLQPIDLGPRRLFVLTMSDLTVRKKAEEVLRFVAETSTILAASLDHATTFASIARRAVPLLGDWAAVDEVLADGTIRRLAVAHADPAKEALAQDLAESYPPLRAGGRPVDEALRTGQSLVENDATDLLAAVATHSPSHAALLGQLGCGSYLVAPMRLQGHVVGALSFVAASPGRYGASELALAEDLALRANVALENARLYRQAQEAIRARDEFLTMISHEVRTPLTSMQLGLQGLLGSARNGTLTNVPLARVTRMLEIVDWQSTHLSRLINDLLDTVVITTGQMSLEMTEVDLSSVVRDAVVGMEAEFVRAGCSVALEAGVPAVGRWDRARLAQVVKHLLSNAIKFGAGQPVEISVQAGPVVATLTVRDHGIGLQPDQIPHIFQRFDRAVSANSYGGLGLGLYIVRQILNALGGAIHVTSTPGAGATFVVELPYQPTASKAE